MSNVKISDILLRVKKLVQERFQGAKGSHDWEHTERVLTLAEHIAVKEGADLDTVRLAAVLHDIGRSEEDQSNGGLDHAARGTKLSRVILEQQRLAPEHVEAVIHCVAAHRFRKGPDPETLEAKVVFDADKLDSLGAVGIGRAFLFAGEVGAKLHNPGADPEKTKPYTEEDTAYREYLVKLRKIKDRILTAEGQRLATERDAFMEEFFARLNQEVSAEL